MTQAEKFEILNPLRYAAAATIAVGGSMHLIGLARGISQGHSFPWWHWAIFIIAILGYTASAVLILKNFRAGYYFTCLSPVCGGILISGGFLWPESGLLGLIPGTYGNEITIFGFITLTSEAIASAGAAFLIMNKVWEDAE